LNKKVKKDNKPPPKKKTQNIDAFAERRLSKRLMAQSYEH